MTSPESRIRPPAPGELSRAVRSFVASGKSLALLDSEGRWRSLPNTTMKVVEEVAAAQARGEFFGMTVVAVALRTPYFEAIPVVSTEGTHAYGLDGSQREDLDPAVREAGLDEILDAVIGRERVREETPSGFRTKFVLGAVFFIALLVAVGFALGSLRY